MCGMLLPPKTKGGYWNGGKIIGRGGRGLLFRNNLDFATGPQSYLSPMAVRVETNRRDRTQWKPHDF